MLGKDILGKLYVGVELPDKVEERYLNQEFKKICGRIDIRY
jgi:hypothetical protein